ncbi:MAG: AMP-binding protein [Gammaproteobacteria bacterium]|nr:AMP-binding protein [Gammaproteobacteria bacterium]
MTQLPLISRNDFDKTWVVTDEGELSVADILFRARALSQQLPGHQYCLLLCEQRVNFIIGFLAALWRGQTVLLPPNRSPEVSESLIADYPDSLCLTDVDKGTLHGDRSHGAEVILYDYAQAESGSSNEIPLIDSSQLACLVFTSGSTGKPAANAKFWGDLVQGVSLMQSRYDIGVHDYLVATVPPQHMYGLETTVLLPMMSEASVYGGMPFYPHDISRVLGLSGKRASLITTPLHLRVIVKAEINWPALRQVISATAPLSQEDAVRVEQLFGVGLREIYGSTESGAIASRNTVGERAWHLYDEVKLLHEKDDGGMDDSTRVIARHLPHQPVLADRIESIDDEHFLMFGRSSDMIKIAGKRASLAGLNHRLNAIAGIEDGVFVQNEADTGDVLRLSVAFVSAELSSDDVIKALGQQIDPVFLPRRVLKVAKLPRNETGKLPHSEMKKILE